MNFQHILFSNENGVLRLTLNRPEVYHALNPLLLKELAAGFRFAAEDETVRVVLLTASGEKAFCSGADLKAALTSKESAGETLRNYYNPLISAIRNLPKPVICRLNGLATGAGASLALACDLVIASETAYLSQIFIQVGLMPDAGATFFLPRLIGQSRAFELASTGRSVPAPEAGSLGLISQSVPAEELDQAVEKAINWYRNAPTLAIGKMKAAFNQSMHHDLNTMLELEAQNQDFLIQTHDAQEAIQSFLIKKKPDFQGK